MTKIDNLKTIAKLVGVEEWIKKEVERKNSPYSKYASAMAKFLGTSVEKIAESEPMRKYYLRFRD